MNVSVNMEKQLSDQLGRTAFEAGATSKGAFIREAIRAHIKRVARDGVVSALALLLWLGAALVAAYGVFGGADQNRRLAGGGARVVRTVRNLNKGRRDDCA